MIYNFVLVEPSVPENIGASARALKTMGFNRLTLVNPCDYLEGKAKWVAHGSSDILESAGCLSSLSDAIDGSSLVIGTTARYRASIEDWVPVTKLSEYISNKDLSGKEVTVVFGREESGLTNEELSLCDITSYIPLAESYPSLNLGQAVMLYAYSLSATVNTPVPSDLQAADKMSVKHLKMEIISLINEAELKINDPVIGRILERISLANQKDMNLMFSLITSLRVAFKRKGKD